MASSTSDMSYWIKFFTDAGIPAGDAANYAVTFTDNRIQKEMLTDLNKEYLNDMGISLLGDIISILKHAKTVHTQVVREKALQGTSAVDSLRMEAAIPTITVDTGSPRKSTPASRTVAHYLNSSERRASPVSQLATPKLSQNLSARLGTPNRADSPSAMIQLNSKKQKEEVPVPRRRRVFPEHEGKYKVTMPAGTTAKTKRILSEQERSVTEEAKSTVFDRLGIDSPKTQPQITVTGLGKISLPSSTQSSVFHRLGNKSAIKRPATSTTVFVSDDLDDDLEEEKDPGPALEYAGILKNSGKKAKLTAAKKKREIAHKTLNRIQNKEISTTAGILSPDAHRDAKGVKARLGPAVSSSSVSEVISTTTAKKKTTPGAGIKGRLGEKVADSTPTSSKTGVFSRLGKTV